MATKCAIIIITILYKHFLEWEWYQQSCLKMLGLYLYTLIIGHKSCNMLSILNKLRLQKKLQNVVTCYVVLDKKAQQNHAKPRHKPQSVRRQD